MPSAAMAPGEETIKLDNKDALKYTLDDVQKLIKSIEKKVKNLEKEMTGAKSKNTENLEEATKSYNDAVSNLNDHKILLSNLKKTKIMGNDNTKSEEKKKVEKPVGFNEMRKIQMVLKNQVVLNRLQDPNVREDFLKGRFGAMKIEPEHMKDLDRLHKVINPPSFEDRPKTDTEFQNRLAGCSKHLYNLTEGKSRKFVKDATLTYRQLRQLIHKITICSYPNLNCVEDTASSPNTISIEEQITSPTFPESPLELPKVEEIETPTPPSSPQMQQPPVHLEPQLEEDSEEQISLPNLQPDPVTFNQDEDLRHSQFMKMKNFMMTRNFNFLQESMLPEQAYTADTAVVTFGSIKPDCYMDLDNRSNLVEDSENENTVNNEDDRRVPIDILNSVAHLDINQKPILPESVAHINHEVNEISHSSQLYMDNSLAAMQNVPFNQIPVTNRPMIEPDINNEPKSPTQVSSMEFVNKDYQAKLNEISSYKYSPAAVSNAPVVPQGVELNQIVNHSNTMERAAAAIPEAFEPVSDKANNLPIINKSVTREEPVTKSWADDTGESFSNGQSNESTNGWTEENKGFRNDDYKKWTTSDDSVWHQDNMNWSNPETEEKKSDHRGGRGWRGGNGGFRGRSFSNSNGSRSGYNNNYRARGNPYRSRPNFRSNGNPRGSANFRGNFNEHRGNFNEHRGNFNENRGNYNENRGNFNDNRGSYNVHRGNYSTQKAQ